MSEQLSKIERPPVEGYMAARKIYFIPLIFIPRQPQPDLDEIVNRYWEQAQTQLTNLETKLSKANRVYHELIPVGSEEGAKAIEEINKGSYQIARARLDGGAELFPLESADLLTEFMDWSKCLAVGLQNPKVFDRVWEFYSDAQKRRNEYMAKQIDESLKPGEAGILLMREGHAVQFPTDIQVFYISPPGLDEINRWFREREAKMGLQRDEKQDI